MSHIFISYSQQDKKIAQVVRRVLTADNVTGWLDIENIRLGGDWRTSIDQAIKSAAAMIVILSKNSNRCQYVTYEWAYALGAGIKVLPILSGVAVEKIPLRLQALQCHDLSSGRKKWQRLTRAIGSVLEEAKPSEVNSVVNKEYFEKPPLIVASFELNKNGVPKIYPNKHAPDGYGIYCQILNVPKATSSVTYEIFDDDDTFEEDELKWTSRSKGSEFKSKIKSYGDILLSATGAHAAGRWRCHTTLYDALKRFYDGKNQSQAIQDALRDIERR